MKNVKHIPIPKHRIHQKATAHHAVHAVNPAGTKIGKQIQRNRGVPKYERGGVVFAGYAAKVCP